jgi:hypothetical protein
MEVCSTVRVVASSIALQDCTQRVRGLFRSVPYRFNHSPACAGRHPVMAVRSGEPHSRRECHLGNLDMSWSSRAPASHQPGRRAPDEIVRPVCHGQSQGPYDGDPCPPMARAAPRQARAGARPGAPPSGLTWPRADPRAPRLPPPTGTPVGRPTDDRQRRVAGDPANATDLDSPFSRNSSSRIVHPLQQPRMTTTAQAGRHPQVTWTNEQRTIPRPAQFNKDAYRRCASEPDKEKM